ncbi:UNVERIFIED_CONTAM: Brassinosteroid-responsive RING protein 1 [Sesamum calycinum]|uniref:Brassinosteroid-responsive RING protein 1 n=1 Tax=Sesamum calycinum TaxID=2727403 RepID=A0AAW2NV02_9LAMI
MRSVCAVQSSSHICSHKMALILCTQSPDFFYVHLLRFSHTNSSSPSSSCCSSSSSSSANLKIVRDSLSLTTLGNIEHRLPESSDLSCAVCLNRLRKSSQVWELRNCCHVFHKHCLEKWLCYDNRLTCPLCRASLLSVSSLPPASQPEPPSWAVERMLYLFGDDLLP